MGALATAVKAGPPPDRRKRCGVCKWVASLDAEDQATLADLMPKAVAAQDGWNYSNLWATCKGIQGNALDMALPAFTKHVKGECARG